MTRSKLNMAATALLAMGFTACTGEAPDTSPDTRDEVRVSFRLAMNEKGGGPLLSDAPADMTWMPGSYLPDDEGNEYDNTIRPASLRIFITDGAGRLAAEVGRLSFAEAGAPMQYDVTGTVKPSGPGAMTPGTYTLVVTANASGIEPSADGFLAASRNWAFSGLGADGSHLAEGIPMYGLLRTDLTLEKGESQQLPDIHLLRAMAKVQVELNAATDAAKLYELAEVRFDDANARGHVVPGGVSEQTTSTTDIKIGETLRPLSSPLGSAATFRHPGGSKTLAMAYVPEWDNAASGPAMISLKVREKATGEVYEFSGNGERFRGISFADHIKMNIIRNHYYKITIDAINTDRPALEQLRFRVSIADMEKGGEWDYEID